MTEYLYHVGFDIAVKALSREDADELVKQFTIMVETAILGGAEIWSLDYEFKGEGDE